MIPEPTYGVSELCQEIRSFLKEAYRSFWVAGEIQRLRPSNRGHVYFELVEKDDADDADGIVGRIDAVMWRGDFDRIRRTLEKGSQRLAEGMEIRCRGELDFWPPGGRLQLVVREVDPVFTLGLLEQRRRETLAALAREGLLELNRDLDFPFLPLRVGLVTSHESAAYHDFLSGLKESGYGFQVTFVHASVQGAAAETEIRSALAALGRLSPPLDCIALIRGGGARSDLAAFDSRTVAEAVARCPVPVLTGLGHEIDESISDRVAHTAAKTPTKVAEVLVECLAEADYEVAEIRRRLLREALEPLKSAAERLERADRALKLAATRLAAAGSRVEQAGRLLVHLALARLGQAREGEQRLAQQLAAAAPRSLARMSRRPGEIRHQVLALARSRIAREAATLAGFERLCRQLAPERTLERGFSITRTAEGTILRRPEQAPAGTEITTELSQGSIRSRVET